MKKVIAALNMTMDGICDHTAGIPDEELHHHYTKLLDQGDIILYGRITYQLMQFWQRLIEEPSEDKSMNDFATAIDKIPKMVFSTTLQELNWESAFLADKELKETIGSLKDSAEKDILVGSRSLIIQLLNLGLIDEFQLCIHPLLEAQGLKLFEGIKDRLIFNLVKTKTFKSGVIILYYEPQNQLISR